jgi:predicted enzyme related to lactoylglutathione lyase
MSARFDLVTIDTAHTERLAAFWCAALVLHESQREDDGRWIVLSEADGLRRIGLQHGVHRPGGPHLDLICDRADFDLERARLIALGAVERRPPRAEPYGVIANLADPDGNLFDLCAYSG